MSSKKIPIALVEKRNQIAERVDKAISCAISEYGYTEDQIISLLGITSETLKKYRKGTTAIDAGQIFFIASISKKPYEYFFGNSDDPFTGTNNRLEQLEKKIAELVKTSQKPATQGDQKPDPEPVFSNTNRGVRP